MADDREVPARAYGPTNDQHQEFSLTSVTPDTARAAAPFTTALVEERLRKAVALQAALVLERRVNAIVAGREPERIGTIGGIGSPLPGDSDDGLVAHAVEALSWLRWLEPEDAALVRARLAGAPWKSICWRFAISRPTADRRYRYGLALTAWHLNGHGSTDRTPSLRALLGLRRAA
jgi:hypothetical protein